SCPTTRSSSPPSTTRSSTRARTGPSRCSASLSGRQRATPANGLLTAARSRSPKTPPTATSASAARPERPLSSLPRMEGNQRLFETFVRLCEIRSPTGEEREIADTLAAELRALGCEVEEDDAAGPAEAGAGNLLARLPGQRDEWVMFCAHIDTVPHKGR